MTKIIQMIKVAENNNLYIIDYENDYLTFRVSQNPEQLQKEKIIIEGDKVYTNLYFFHVGFLQKFLNEVNFKANAVKPDEV